MILGLCGSFAVVPAVSLAGGGSRRAPRRVASAQRRSTAANLGAAPGSVGLAALVLSIDALSAVPPGGTGTQPVGTASVTLVPPSPPFAGDASAPTVAGGTTGQTPSASSALAVPVPVVPPTTTVPPTTVPARPVVTSPPTVPKPVVTPRAALAQAQQGVASWLNTIPAGTCANNGAPMGAIITVTNGTGVSITCKVVSRGPFVTGRIVDIAEPTFAQLGSVSRGLVSVTVSW